MYDEIKEVLKFTNNGDKFTLGDVGKLQNVEVKNFIFAVGRHVAREKHFKFNDWSEFSIPYGWVWSKQSGRWWDVSLFGKPVDGAYDFLLNQKITVCGKPDDASLNE